jgi:NlpC/P60 family/Bacterial dipeptidyl-peptidase Sh3 domain
MLYRTQADLNLYSSLELDSLATQAATGRWVQVSDGPTNVPTQVTLVEDDYPGWLAPADRAVLVIADRPYVAPVLTRGEIADRLPAVMAFAQAAMAVPNEYLWGGTVAPNYDCSGLMQAAFGSQGIQLPRDAYQQEAFVEPVDFADLQLGDLVFFGPPEKAKHVGLYLGDNAYLHSSGRDIGRNGIGIDELTLTGHAVSRNYFSQWRGAGRVVRSYFNRSGQALG